MDKFWSFVRNVAAVAGEPDANLLLYGDISDTSWYGDEVTPAAFASDLAGLGDVGHIGVRINSRGGDLFAGQAIHSMLKAHPAKVTTYVDGLAASSASIIAMAGDEVHMPANSMMMVHNPSTSAYGDARDMRQAAAVLDQVREPMIAVYQSKSGLDRSTIINHLNSETWMTADQAKGFGYADKVVDPIPVSAQGGAKYKINNLAMDFSTSSVWPGATLMSATAAEPADEDAAAAAAEAERLAAEQLAQAASAADAANLSPIENALRGERVRIAEINALSIGLAGVDALKAKAINNGMSPADFSHELVRSGLVRNNQQLEAIRAAAQAANIPYAAPASGGASTNREAAANAIAEAAMKLRGIKK